jgi:hypothetical protein
MKKIYLVANTKSYRKIVDAKGKTRIAVTESGNSARKSCNCFALSGAASISAGGSVVAFLHCFFALLFWHCVSVFRSIGFGNRINGYVTIYIIA